MKNIAKKVFCILLCFVLCFGFAGCSSNELSEENVISTVEKVEKALKNLDINTLKKYAKSETVTYYSDLLDSNQDLSNFVKIEDLSSAKSTLNLVNAIFENLTIEVVSVNLEEQTVDVAINNKSLYSIAALFTYELTTQYSSQQILEVLGNEEIMNEKVATLLEKIEQVPVNEEPQIITLKIQQTDDNLVLVFDKNAEYAVTGGVITAVLTFLNTQTN